MSQTDWVAEQRDAYNDLAEDGVMFTFTRTVKGAFDPVRGAYGPGETLTFTAPGIMKALNTSSGAAQRWQEQALIQEGDEMLLIGCGTYEPELGDRVDIDGAAWAVKGVSSLRPGVVPLLNYLLIRRA